MILKIYLIGYVIVFFILTIKCLIEKKELKIIDTIVNIYISSMSWLIIMFLISNKYEKLFKQIQRKPR